MSRHAVILAGGKGSRLAPYTMVLPKPLLPVGDRAILEIVIEQLRLAGFTELTFAVGYLAHLIQAVFGDGSGHGVRISYHHETEPLGTAGPLGAIELEGTVLVMNGDVLTALDYNELFEAHQASGNLLTVASHRRVVRDDYGVIQVDGGDGPMRAISGYLEKPEHEYLVSMGVYVMDASIQDHIPQGERFDIPDLVLRLLEEGEPVGSYASGEYWLDIGRHDDYEKANAEIDEVLPRLMNTRKP
jgi:NDP-sugar pyrophosphorylase family protein